MNNYSIILSPQFLEELDRIYYYFNYSLYSPEAADNLRIKVEHFISRLDLFPERYSLVPIKSNLKYRNLRKIPVGKYIILYEVDNDTQTVYILYIFYGRQNYLYNL